MNRAGLIAWAKQPTTIAGFATAAATIIHTAGQALAHQVSWPVAIGAMAGAAVLMLVPDNTGAQADVRRAAVDAATAVLTKRLADMAPTLFADAAAVSRDVTAPAPVAAP